MRMEGSNIQKKGNRIAPGQLGVMVSGATGPKNESRIFKNSASGVNHPTLSACTSFISIYIYTSFRTCCWMGSLLDDA